MALALVFGLVSCVKDKPYPGITISNVSYSPTAVQADQPVTVTATISSFNDFTAKVVYKLNSSEKEVAMTAGTTYTAVIPGYPDGTTISFYIEASNDDVTMKSDVKEYTVGAVQIDYTVLRLNELNGNDKFIEIYNTGSDAINLAGVNIEKDGAQKWAGTSDINIEAGGYVVLYSVDVQGDHPELPEYM